MNDDFSTFDIQKGLRIPRERFRQWVKEGFITPSIQAAGAGTRASFTRIDVYRVALFKHLIERGFSRSKAANFVEMFHCNLDCEYLSIMCRNGSCIKAYGTSGNFKIVLDEVWDFDDIFIVNFGKIRNLVDRRMRAA